MVHGAMAVGLPHGVTEATIGGPAPATDTASCACGCGRTVDTEYEHYRSGDELFYDRECTDRYFEIEYVG